MTRQIPSIFAVPRDFAISQTLRQIPPIRCAKGLACLHSQLCQGTLPSNPSNVCTRSYAKGLCHQMTPICAVSQSNVPRDFAVKSIQFLHSPLCQRTSPSNPSNFCTLSCAEGLCRRILPICAISVVPKEFCRQILPILHSLLCHYTLPSNPLNLCSLAVPRDFAVKSCQFLHSPSNPSILHSQLCQETLPVKSHPFLHSQLCQRTLLSNPSNFRVKSFQFLHSQLCQGTLRSNSCNFCTLRCLTLPSNPSIFALSGVPRDFARKSLQFLNSPSNPSNFCDLRCAKGLCRQIPSIFPLSAVPTDFAVKSLQFMHSRCAKRLCRQIRPMFPLSAVPRDFAVKSVQCLHSPLCQETLPQNPFNFCTVP